MFNLAQIDDLPERFASTEALSHALPGPERIEHADAFFAATGAEVRHGGADRIQLPSLKAFRDAESSCATRGHETVHWTRHPSRLDRSLGRKRFLHEGYARKELVAELGSAFLADDLGVSLEPRPDHAAYLASWITLLQDDMGVIVSAAAHAERAVKFLHGMLMSSAEFERVRRYVPCSRLIEEFRGAELAMIAEAEVPAVYDHLNALLD